MNCPVCGQNKPLLVLEDNQPSCSVCYLAQLKTSPAEFSEHDYAKNLVARDFAGQEHDFSLNYIADPLSWQAAEKDGYFFLVRAKKDESPRQALARLLIKVTAGLGQRNLLAGADEPAGLTSRHYLAPVGSGRIASDTETGACQLVLDGQILAAEDFFTLLSTYSGHQLIFQIQDPSMDVLEKDMALLYCRIDAHFIQDQFSKRLSWFLDGSFLSYKREAALASALEDPLTEFRLFCRYRSRPAALALGQQLIEYLRSFQTDAQNFPQEQIRQIKALLADEKL